MKEDLKTIFQDNVVRSIYGTVKERVNSKTYIVTIDYKDSTVRVQATQEWSVGAKVLIQNGIIVGTSKLPDSYNVYSV